jgi:hypothetical protein
MAQELVVAHAPTARMSIGCDYDSDGLLQHISLNREDRAGWPSAFWSRNVTARRFSAVDAATALGLDAAAAARARGSGTRVGADIKQDSLSDVAWAGHSWALDGCAGGVGEAPVVLGLPEGLWWPALRGSLSASCGVRRCCGSRTGLRGGGLVQSLETRYSPTSIESFLHLKFTL